MAALPGVVRAEYLKVVSVRMWWVLMIVLLGYIGFTAGVLALAFGGIGSISGTTVPPIPEAILPPLIYSVASSIGYVFPVLFGTLATTTEFRHQTLTPTFLATPRRGIVLAAKLAVTAFFGMVYALVALVASVGVGAAILAATGHDTGLGQGDTWLMIARIVLAMVLWAVIGVGLGALIPNQVAAVVVVLAFTQFVEPILRLVSSLSDLTGSVGQFLPGAASDALVGSSIFTFLGAAGGSVTSLDWWQGGLILLGIAAAVTGLGLFTNWRKDVT
ncbi:MAG: ABC transporter permease [Terrimesophilobacter sp.]